MSIMLETYGDIMLGEKFGKLTVVSRCGTDKRRNYYWECVCECGNRVFPRSYSLKNGNTKSCGCTRRKPIGHVYPKNYDELVSERLEKNCEKKSGCWEWKGCIKKFGSQSKKPGYGRTTYKGENWTTHRLMYYLKKGKIPQEMCVLHKCDNPLCINPEHLFLGTQRENMRDMHRKKRHPWSKKDERA